MFLFQHNTDAPINWKAVFVRIVIAAIVFWLLLSYLIPMITIEPLHTLLGVGVVLCAIFFLLDLVF